MPEQSETLSATPAYAATAADAPLAPMTIERRRPGPLLCAGITTYSPLRHWGVGKGDKVGIVGLGHMGVKLAHAFGAHVVLFTTSPGKVQDAKRLGADEVVISKHADEMQRHGTIQRGLRANAEERCQISFCYRYRITEAMSPGCRPLFGNRCALPEAGFAHDTHRR